MNVYDSDYIEADSSPMGTLQSRLFESIEEANKFKKEVLLEYKAKRSEGHGESREG